MSAKRNFRALVTRRAGSRFFNTLTQQYVNIYMVELGLRESDVGLVNSTSTIVAVLPTTLLSFMADVKSRKIAYLIGLFLEMLSPLIYFIDGNLSILVLAASFSTIAFFGSSRVENILVADSVRGRERGFAFSVINSISTLVAIFSPVIAAYIINYMGGLSAEGIRPLFLIQFIGLALVSLPALLFIQDVRPLGETSLLNSIKDSIEIIKLNPWLRKWILVEVLGGYVFSISMPFQMIYAARVKHANEFIIGYMGLAFNIGNIVSSPLIGKLADKIGRVKTIVILRPLFYSSLLLLILAPSPEYLILAWLLRGIFFSSVSPFQALSLELVPYEYRGRWSAIRVLLSMLFRSPAPYLGGILYTMVAPETPFILAVIVDLFLRLPLIASMPETLNRREYLSKFKSPNSKR